MVVEQRLIGADEALRGINDCFLPICGNGNAAGSRHYDHRGTAEQFLRSLREFSEGKQQPFDAPHWRSKYLCQPFRTAVIIKRMTDVVHLRLKQTTVLSRHQQAGIMVGNLDVFKNRSGQRTLGSVGCWSKLPVILHATSVAAMTTESLCVRSGARSPTTYSKSPSTLSTDLAATL